MKTSELHIAPDRRDRFAGLTPKVWLESFLLRTWVIAEPGLIVEILRSPNAAILNVDDMVEAIELRYGVEFPNVRFAARHLPLFLEGDLHAERRQSFSRYLAARLAELESHLPELVEHHLQPLRRNPQVELVSEITGPLVRDINAIFAQRPLTKEIGSLDLLDLFALNKSLARFKDLDLRVKKAIEFLADESEDEQLLGCRFTALAMGFETLMTMLTEGLLSAFNQHAEHAGDLAVLPEFPIETGVPISYRRAVADFEMAGHRFNVGDLLRLQLQTLGYSSSEDDRKGIFGAGAHSCVGKQASLRIWAVFKQAFDDMALRGRIISCELTPSHYLVRHKSVQIEVFR